MDSAVRRVPETIRWHIVCIVAAVVTVVSEFRSLIMRIGILSGVVACTAPLPNADVIAVRPSRGDNADHTGRTCSSTEGPQLCFCALDEGAACPSGCERLPLWLLDGTVPAMCFPQAVSRLRLVSTQSDKCIDLNPYKCVGTLCDPVLIFDRMNSFRVSEAFDGASDLTLTKTIRHQKDFSDFLGQARRVAHEWQVPYWVLFRLPHDSFRIAWDENVALELSRSVAPEPQQRSLVLSRPDRAPLDLEIYAIWKGAALPAPVPPPRDSASDDPPPSFDLVVQVSEIVTCGMAKAPAETGHSAGGSGYQAGAGGLASR